MRAALRDLTATAAPTSAQRCGTASSLPCVSANDALARVIPAGAGDHAAVYHLLTSVFHAPSPDSFHAWLDDPFYEPRHRLLVKRGERVVSHVHLTERTASFGSLRLPVVGLNWLATLPEFRRSGYGGLLLQASDSAMRRSGSVLGLLTTRHPHFFRRHGWSVCGRHSHARAGSRHLLAQLSARGQLNAEESLNIRPWRQVELPALMRIYSRNQAPAYGGYERSEAYWRWLVSRKHFDQIYVALDGPEKYELDIAGTPIVGYAITKDDRVLELMCDPDHPTAAEQLLARACSEAIERDYHSLTLHAPPGDRLFSVFCSAGGEQYNHELHQGEVFMAKLLDPQGFLRALRSELHARAENARFPRPCGLGLHVHEEKLQLAATRRSVKVSSGKLGRSYLRLNLPEFTRLVLGHLDVQEAINSGRIRASTRYAVEAARILFPRLPLWRSPLDELTG